MRDCQQSLTSKRLTQNVVFMMPILTLQETQGSPCPISVRLEGR
jgi:hypothetical protein